MSQWQVVYIKTRNMLRESNIFTHNIDIAWKTFVRESDDVAETPSKKKEYRLRFQGNQAKNVYEEIINLEGNANVQSENHKLCKLRTSVQSNTTSKSTVSIEKAKKGELPEERATINSILKAVEQKDMKFLMRHVTQDNVNLTDNFGWTPLMSAAYCGHLDVVKVLLSLGANKRPREKSGLTAAQLALKKNYLSIVALLRRKTESRAHKGLAEINSRDTSADTRAELIEPLKHSDGNVHKSTRNEHSQGTTAFYCEICKSNFYQTTWKKHQTSTLHVFCTKPKLPNAMYGISKQNKGYQMLLNTGWDEEGGLGPSGQGIQYPIKTCLKTDRKGIGQANEKEYRVTHFKPGDTAAVKNHKYKGQPKGLKKKDREKLLNREVRKERALRVALS